MIISSVHYKELERIKYCQGCKHLSLVWCNGCCMYYLNTGYRRPNPAGVPDCKVREITANQAEIDAVNKKLQDALDTAERNRIENAPKWDVELARKMYDDGKSFQEIATAVKRKRSIIVNYANKHKWGRRENKNHAE